VYKRVQLEQMLATTKFRTASAQVENDCCKGDLLFSLLMRPSEHLDFVLEQCHAIVLKKNAPDMSRPRIITDTWALLIRAGNYHVKLFNFLFMLHHEPEVQEMIRRGYLPPPHPGNLWGNHAHTHLADFLLRLKSMVAATLTWPCSEHNISDVVHNFVHAAQSAYLTL
jgi:hypothetical protein